MISGIKDVVLVGHLGWEYIYKERKSRKDFPGGSALRFAIFSNPWLKIRLFSVAGSKERWSMTLKSLSKVGIDTTAVKFLDKEIQFFIHYDTNFKVKKFKIENSVITQKIAHFFQKITLKKNNLLHICPLDTKTQSLFIDLAKKKNIPISLQVHFSSLKQEDILNYLRMIRKVDILFLNESEALTLTSKKNKLSAGRAIASHCKGLVFITAAADSVMVFKNGKLLLTCDPIIANEISDVTGAGDAFAAGVVSGLINCSDERKATILGLITANLSLNFDSTLKALDFFMSIYEKKKE